MPLHHLRLRLQLLVPRIQRVPDHVPEIAGDRGGGPDRVRVLQIPLGNELQQPGIALRNGRPRQRGRQRGSGARSSQKATTLHWMSPPKDASVEKDPRRRQVPPAAKGREALRSHYARGWIDGLT